MKEGTFSSMERNVQTLVLEKCTLRREVLKIHILIPCSGHPSAPENSYPHQGARMLPMLRAFGWDANFRETNKMHILFFSTKYKIQNLCVFPLIFIVFSKIPSIHNKNNLICLNYKTDMNESHFKFHLK